MDFTCSSHLQVLFEYSFGTLEISYRGGSTKTASNRFLDSNHGCWPLRSQHDAIVVPSCDYSCKSRGGKIRARAGSLVLVENDCGSSPLLVCLDRIRTI